jgi:hypothetical protein
MVVPLTSLKEGHQLYFIPISHYKDNEHLEPTQLASKMGELIAPLISKQNGDHQS